MSAFSGSGQIPEKEFLGLVQLGFNNLEIEVSSPEVFQVWILYTTSIEQYAKLDDREGLCIIQFCQALFNVQTQYVKIFVIVLGETYKLI